MYEKSKASVSIFTEILLSIWMKFSMLPQAVGLLKHMLNVFCISNVQGRELCWHHHDFIKYTFTIVQSCIGTLMNWFISNLFLFQTWYESMMLNTTKHYRLIPDRCSFNFKVKGLKERLNLCHHSVVELQYATQVFEILIMSQRWLWRSPVTKYGEYGAFEHLQVLSAFCSMKSVLDTMLYFDFATQKTECLIVFDVGISRMGT